MKGEHVKRSLSTLSTLSRNKCSALPIKCSVPDVIRQLTFFPSTSVFSLISLITSAEPFSRIILSLVWDVYGGGGGGGSADAEFRSIR